MFAFKHFLNSINNQSYEIEKLFDGTILDLMIFVISVLQRKILIIIVESSFIVLKAYFF